MRPIMCLSLFAGATVSLAGASNALAAPDASTSNSPDEIRALVAEMLADADGRSSLLQSGGTAGHDGHFFLASSDGNFRLNIAGQIQFRYILNFRKDRTAAQAPPLGEDDFEPGFQTRRTRLAFSGNVYDPDLTYYVQGDFNRATGLFTLLDAWVGYNFDNGWKVKWGQFKLPLLREELVSSKRQLSVDRSATNEFFSQNRSQGIEFSYGNDNVRFALAISDGLSSLNTDLAADPADFAITGRAQWLIRGDWDQFNDFTSSRGSDYGVMLGAAAHFEEGADRPGPVGMFDRQIAEFTADVSVEGDGWNFYAAGIGRNINYDLKSAAAAANPFQGSRTDFGLVAQGGYYITDDVEAFVRYDQIFLDDSSFAASDFKTLTFGGNYYLHGHAAKFTLDVTWFLDASRQFVDAFGNADPNLSVADTGIARLGSVSDDEVSIRAQFQLLF